MYWATIMIMSYKWLWAALLMAIIAVAIILFFTTTSSEYQARRTLTIEVNQNLHHPIYAGCQPDKSVCPPKLLSPQTYQFKGIKKVVLTIGTWAHDKSYTMTFPKPGQYTVKISDLVAGKYPNVTCEKYDYRTGYKSDCWP